MKGQLSKILMRLLLSNLILMSILG